MALIGTISGSNGTTTSAVTGSLIIAADPSTITPVKPTDVVLFVSGAATSIGAELPSILFKGDSFVSGAFGTDSYFQMKPVGTLRIPTNTTASYIYTSGSTNDIYFTQYSGPYTNTTRLRWMEGMLSTGLFHGGVLSTATGSTTFSITSGSGIILTYNASLTTDPYPTINYVNWPAYVSQSLTYVTSSLLTYIGVNASGGIIQQTSPFTLTADSDYITIGRVLHQSGSVTNGVATQPLVSYGNNHWQDDFMRAFGPLKVSGHILAASGSTLGITKTAGDSYVIGRNYTTDPNNPNNITSTTDTAVTVSKIYRAYVSGSTLRLDTGVNNAGYTTVDPTKYNNNGVTGSVGSSEASIQRVYWYPNTVSRAFTVYYGSAVYSDPPGGTNALDVAQQNIASENFVEGENTAGAAILVGYILALGSATDLSNTAQARFIQAGVSRGAGAGGGGGVAVGATSAAGLDTYVQFNDGGSTFGGDAGLTYNKTTDTLTIAGDLAVNGGDITTSAGTFNLVNSTATTVNLGGDASAVNIGAAGSATTFAGNITGSNALFSGDVVINGGDLTSTAATFNLFSGSVGNTLNVGATTGIIQIGNATGASTVRLAYGNTATPAIKTVEIGVNGQSGSTTNITLGAAAGSGRTTFNNDVALATGNIIGAPGSGANVMTLISSGNIIARLDTDASADGHKFAVQDYRNIDQFSVNENGNAEISGSLVVSGSSIQTVTTTTYNLLTTALTGTLNVGSLASSIIVGGTTTTSSFTGATQVDGRSTLSSITEKMVPSVGGTGTVAYDLSVASIFYANGPTGDVTANFTNVPTTNNRIITPTVILSQSATPRIVSALQIDTVAQTINWANGTTPTGTANKQDVFGFSLIRSGSAWKVLGQMSTYG